MAEGFFFPTDPNDPRASFNLRQRIALEMMKSSAKNRGYPKNLGEGLTAIGDALGEIGMARRLQEADVAQQKLLGPDSEAARGAPAEQPLTPPATNMAPPANQKVAYAPSNDTVAPDETPAQPATENMIDAQAGFKYSTPGYIQDSIMKATSDPERQAYLGSLVAKEKPGSGPDVSRTGARGAFQFIPSTAKQYGLTNPDDNDAAAVAANRLTDDNVAEFTQKMGRAPNYQEMAAMHQQGAGTVIKMLQGTGNASPGNLAVNNIPAGSSAQQALAKINAYYGMPARVPTPQAAAPPPSPTVAQPPQPALSPQAQLQRNRIALATPGASQPNPTLPGPSTGVPSGSPASSAPPPGGPDSALAFDGTPRPPLPPIISQGQQIRTAPPPPPPVRQAPVAQTPAQIMAAPMDTTNPSYTLPQVAEPTMMPQTPQSEREVYAQKMLSKFPGDPYAEATFRPMLNDEIAKRQYRDAQIKALQEANLHNYESMTRQRPEQAASAAQRGVTYAKSQAEAIQEQAKVGPALQAAELATRTGMPAEKAQAQFDTLKTTAQKDVFTLQQLSLARDALRRGIVSGAGANMKLNIERYKAWLASDPRAAALASNSEQFLAAMKSTIAGALQNIQPGDTRVTNADQLLALGTVGGDLSNQLATQQKLVDIASENTRKRIGTYEDLKDHYLHGLPLEKMYDIQINPLHHDATVEKAWVDKLVQHQTNPAAIAQFNKEFGPGAAELEIARAARRNRRLGGP